MADSSRRGLSVGVLVDPERWRHEGLMIQQQLRGLVERGIRPLLLLPLSIDAAAVRHEVPEVPVHLFAEPLAWWRRRGRARRLAGELPGTGFDVLVAVGEGSWAFGGELARVLDVPLVLDVWSLPLARHLPVRRAARTPAAYLAASEPVGLELRARVDPSLVSVIPFGVAVPDEPHASMERADDVIAVAVLGRGHDVGGFLAALRGLKRARDRWPQIQAFVELRSRHDHEIWHQIERLDLLATVSCLSDAAPFRTLLTDCDLLMLPEAEGQCQSVVLEAMGAGLPVIVRDGSDLMDGSSLASWPVRCGGHPDEWADALQTLCSSVEEARRIGAMGRSYVQRWHRVEDQVERLAHTLRQVVEGDRLVFEQRTG